MIDLNDHISRLKVRILERLVELIDRSAGDADLLKARKPKVGVMSAEAQVERRVNLKLHPDDVILQWIVRWAPMLLSRYSVGQDEHTACERQRWRACEQEVWSYHSEKRCGTSNWRRKARRRCP